MRFTKWIPAVLVATAFCLPAAITTIDGVIAGMTAPEDVIKVGAATTVGRWYSPFYVAGRPGAATAPSPGIAGAALTTYAGQIPFTNPGSGNTYLARFSGTANVLGTLILADRLWHNSGITVTSTASQNINSATWPARDSACSTNGANVMIGAEVSTVMGAGTPTWTMGYTDSAGNAGNSTVTAAQATTMAVGSFIPIQLAAGDTGVRSIQTWQQSATMTSGVYHLVAYRILARVPVTIANVDSAVDALTSGFPIMCDNTVPFLLWLPATTTAPTLTGQMVVTQG
jgi:hypothetical protein